MTAVLFVVFLVLFCANAFFALFFQAHVAIDLWSWFLPNTLMQPTTILVVGVLLLFRLAKGPPDYQPIKNKDWKPDFYAIIAPWAFPAGVWFTGWLIHNANPLT